MICNYTICEVFLDSAGLHGPSRPHPPLFGSLEPGMIRRPIAAP